MSAVTGAWVAIAATLATAGCGTDAPAGPATFTAVYATMFPRSTKYQCNFCHGLPSNELSNGKLSMGMDQAAAYAALVAQPSTSAMCGGMELVVPGDPDRSLLYLKLAGTPPCGDPMPLAGAALTATQLRTVRTWIVDGAQDD